MSANPNDYKNRTQKQRDEFMAKVIKQNRQLVLVTGIGQAICGFAAIVFIVSILIKRGFIL